MRQPTPYCSLNQIVVIVAVDARGDLSTLDPELLAVHTERFGDFVFGHVLHHSLVDVAQSAKFQQAQADIRAGVEARQRSCTYLGLCGGGAGSNKCWGHGRLDGPELHACRYRIQWVAEVVLAGLERQLGLVA